LEPLISIARIVKTRGIRGEVVGELLTDFPERFQSLTQVHLTSASLHLSAEIEDRWFHQGRVILKFAGWDSPEAARTLVGCEVQIPQSERVELPEDTYFDSDLEQCRVLEQGREIGRVTSVWRVGGSASTLVVEDEHGQEFLVPFVAEFVISVDLPARRIEVRLPPGLKELAIGGHGRGG
jgi:16S rRNA processing protein RimM